MAPTMPHIDRVDRARFPTALATLRDVLQHASFVAFDTELSGLSTQLGKPSPMDSVEQRYMQMRESAQAFAIVQFGLSVFTWRPHDRVFDVQTFQFPIFPLADCSHHTHSELPDRSFLVQAKCLTYIREHGFDLNAWVDCGIGYLSHDEQRQCAHVLDRPLRVDVVDKFRNDTSTAIRIAENERFLKDMRKRIDVLRGLEFKADDNGDTEAMAAFLCEHIKVVRPIVHHDSAGRGWRAFVTEPQAPFRRSALIAMVDKEFPDVVVLDCPADNDTDPEVKVAPWKRRLRVIAARDTKEKTLFRNAHDKVLQQEHDDRNLSLVGFTAVFDELVKSGRRIALVGHNMLLDMMQCFEKFHGPLPDSCSRFLFQLHKWLGEVAVFDTKVLIEYAMDHINVFGERLEHSALEYVYECVSKDPFQGPPTRDVHAAKDKSRGEAPLSAHQAGYDAYMTGIVFLRACSGLGVPNEAIATIGTVDAHRDGQPLWQTAIFNLQNTVKMGQLLPPVELKLPGPFPDTVPTPSREQFLRVNLTRAWLPKLKAHHIQHCIAWALNIRPAKSIVVRYENKSSVFVQLPSREQADKLVEVRKDCKEIHGTDRDPLPSLGCVDLSRIEDASLTDQDTTGEPQSKRQKIEG